MPRRRSTKSKRKSVVKRKRRRKRNSFTNVYTNYIAWHPPREMSTMLFPSKLRLPMKFKNIEAVITTSLSGGFFVMPTLRWYCNDIEELSTIFSAQDAIGYDTLKAFYGTWCVTKFSYSISIMEHSVTPCTDHLEFAVNVFKDTAPAHTSFPDFLADRHTGGSKIMLVADSPRPIHFSKSVNLNELFGIDVIKEADYWATNSTNPGFRGVCSIGVRSLNPAGTVNNAMYHFTLTYMVTWASRQENVEANT